MQRVGLGPLRHVLDQSIFRAADKKANPPLMPWSRRFDEPIELSDGRELVTLRDAGNYITKLPKAEHEAPEWEAAMQALILVAEKGGPTMLARIGMLRALSRHQQQRTKPAAEGYQKV